MSLALRLRALMRRRGIKSQNQLARLSGVSQSCIHRILTREDHYSPTRGTLLRLARALDTHVPWLTDGMAGPSAVQGAAPSDEYCCGLCTLLRRQPEITQRKVLKVVRLMLEDPGATPAVRNAAKARPVRRPGGI